MKTVSFQSDSFTYPTVDCVSSPDTDFCLGEFQWNPLYGTGGLIKTLAVIIFKTPSVLGAVKLLLVQFYLPLCKPSVLHCGDRCQNVEVHVPLRQTDWERRGFYWPFPWYQLLEWTILCLTSQTLHKILSTAPELILSTTKCSVFYWDVMWQQSTTRFVKWDAITSCF